MDNKRGLDVKSGHVIGAMPTSFREEVRNLAHTITTECINCGACEPVCPVSCISEAGNVRVIDAGVCIDCGACVDTCPVSAIIAP